MSYSKHSSLNLGIGNSLNQPLKGSSTATWTTTGRPTSPTSGVMGFNITLSQLEIFDGTTWKTLSLS